MRRLVAVFGLFGLGVPSCELGHGCTGIGCADGVNFTVSTADGTWVAGNYRLGLELDGQSVVYGWRFPDDVPSSGTLTLATTAALHLQLTPEATCTEQRSGEAVSQSCTPIPNHYGILGMITGAVATLRITLDRDGNTVLDQSATPAYRSVYPNGAECGPGCQEASLDLEVP
jgi:hypothetical protein